MENKLIIEKAPLDKSTYFEGKPGEREEAAKNEEGNFLILTSTRM